MKILMVFSNYYN